MGNKQSVAVCITGWHYNLPFYEELAALQEVDLFVVSHKKACEVPQHIFQAIDPARFLFRPNLGYDWGCYQQFLDTGHWRDYTYTFFIHDDVTVKNPGFVERCIALLDAGHSVIGNGRIASRRAWPDTSPSAYAHATWKPPRHFVHDVVRGSFFATTRAALAALEKFEVFWDPWHLTSGFGNWSLKASCAKWEARLGEHCFHFLSEIYCRSEYIEEDVRGGQGMPDRPLNSRIRLKLVDRVDKLGNFYMRAYWGEKSAWARPIVLRALNPAIKLVSGT